MADATIYDRDFYAWANEQAHLLRAGRVAEADLANIAEEIESMGRTEKRELISRLRVLLLHLLKWAFQPERRGRSWRASIIVQRRDILRHLDDNPSLRARLPEAVAEAYADAVVSAAAETDLDEAAFPTTCPWGMDQIVSAEFWPMMS